MTPQTGPLVRTYVATRRARDLADRLLGLGAARLADPDGDLCPVERDCGVGCPNSVEGFLVVHADVGPARVYAARARVKAEATMPGLLSVREAGLFPETTLRLMSVKTKPETVGVWIAAGIEARASGNFTPLNGLLREAVKPDPAPAARLEPAPPNAPTLFGPPPTAFRPDTPDSVRARRAQRDAERREGRPPSLPLRLDLKLALDAEQLDAWTQAMQRVRGESRETPTPSQVLVTILEHFAAGVDAPASLEDIRPGRRRYVDPSSGRWHLATHKARIETAPLEPTRDRARVHEVIVRRARGKNASPTPHLLTQEFPELFWDPDSDECRRRVRALLGYAEERSATRPEPPVPSGSEPQPMPTLENDVPVTIVEQLDPRANALPELSGPETRAVMASAGRADPALRWHELRALAALDAAERAGHVPPGTTRAACEGEFVSDRSRQEALWLWRRLEARPALARAMQAGLDYSKVRALADVERAALGPWIAFAWRHPAQILEAHVKAREPGGLPPVVPTGMEPVLPLGTRLIEELHLDLSPAQQQTLAALRAVIEQLHRGPVSDAVFYGDLAGWYVRRRARKTKETLDVVVYQREPETRVPVELRANPAVPDSRSAPKPRRAGASSAGGAGDGGRSVMAAHVPWVLVPGLSVRGDWIEPEQRPGQAYVPVACEEAVLDRDGPRCTTPRCPHDLVPTYNHGTWRRIGGVADPDHDQMECLPCNLDHSIESLVVVNRPDGGVWCWDGQGRLHGSVDPVARHLGGALVARLLDLAERRLVARETAGVSEGREAWAP